MEITIHKAHGKVVLDVFEIESLIKEQLKMVPGIVPYTSGSIYDKFKILISKNGFKTVSVYPISRQVIGVTCHVKLFNGANFEQVAKEAQNFIKFSVEKKYELKVDHIDIIIEGFAER